MYYNKKIYNLCIKLVEKDEQQCVFSFKLIRDN